MPTSEGDTEELLEGDPLIGSVVAEKYRILDLLGRGGMGRIYRAEQIPLGRLVAVKILGVDPEQAQRETFRKRFFLEAATLAKLKHPNNVTVFDYGHLPAANTFYMVMEYVEGVTLSALLRQEGALEVSRALAIAYEVARGLAEAHDIGVVHRDLKPANIMVVPGDEGERVKVLDFGIVKDLSREGEQLTGEHRILGSPTYMAPEQIRCADVDARTDVYSLGVVLYKMLCGKPPFRGDSPVAVLWAHLNTVVPTLRARVEVPEDVEQIVSRCLAKEPAERFEDMKAFRLAVRGALEGLGISSTRPGATTFDTESSEVREQVLLAPTKADEEPSRDTFTLDAAAVPDKRERRWLVPLLIGVLLVVVLLAGGSLVGLLGMAWSRFGPAPTVAPPDQPPVELVEPEPVVTPAADPVDEPEVDAAPEPSPLAEPPPEPTDSDLDILLQR